MVAESGTGLPEELLATLDFVGRLERLGVAYLIGGSVASAIHGEPRATNDVDLSVDLQPRHVAPLVRALGDAYYASEQAMRGAVEHGRSFNVIHLGTHVKIDVFVVGDDAVARRALDRRQSVVLGPEACHRLYVATPEDIVARKLAWYRRGGEVSDRQWRDILGVLRIQATNLDQEYLTEAARALAVEDLLARACAEAADGDRLGP